jgi:hypothetical protein
VDPVAMIMMILNTMNALAPVMNAFVTNALAAWMAVAMRDLK